MFPDLITELLQDGYTVSFSAPGHSMFPTIMANETIMVEPIDPGTVKMGDIILYRTNNHLIAHRVVKIDKKNDCAIAETQIKGDSLLLKRSAHRAKRSSSAALRETDSPLIKHSALQVKRSSSEALHFVLQGDASPSCDAPVKAGQILGKIVSIERNGFSIDPYSLAHKLGCLAIIWRVRIKRLPRKMLSFFLHNRENRQA
jgi:hypothetical protein